MTVAVSPVVTPDDAAAWNRVLSLVYRNRPPDGPADPPRSGETRFLARADGEPAAACQVFERTLVRGGSDLSCGAVAAVATLPTHRRSGVGSALMAATVRWMRDRGLAVSALYAYRETYYRRFGYATCGWRWGMMCPHGRLPRIEGGLPVRMLAPDDVGILDPVYTSFVRRRSGGFLRDGTAWRDRLGIKAPSLYALGDPMEAYAMVTLEQFWGEVSVGECAWSSPAGYGALLDLFGRLASNQSAVAWSEPPDSPFLAHHLDQGVTATLSRPSMVRAVTVAEALAALRPETDGEFAFALGDPVLTDASGPWRVCYRTQGIEVERGGDPDFRLDVGSFSQALLGAPGLLELAGQGAVEVVRPEGLVAASRLMPPTPVVCMDFF